MADEMFPTVLVRWEGNNSKRYDNTKEEILVCNIVAINKTAVIEPSLDQISVGDHIEYKFVAKKWESSAVAWGSCVHRSRRGAPHWFGTQRAGDNVQTSAMSPYHYQRSESSERYRLCYCRTSYCCHVVVWEFEFYQRQAVEASQQFATTRCRTKAEAW